MGMPAYYDWVFRPTLSGLPGIDPFFGFQFPDGPLPISWPPFMIIYETRRVRFLLADDAGAGKTIMAGLLIRELKLRGLAEEF